MCVSYPDQLACMNLTEVNPHSKTERSSQIVQAILQTGGPVNMVWLKLAYGTTDSDGFMVLWEMLLFIHVITSTLSLLSNIAQNSLLRGYFVGIHGNRSHITEKEASIRVIAKWQSQSTINHLNRNWFMLPLCLRVVLRVLRVISVYNWLLVIPDVELCRYYMYVLTPFVGRWTAAVLLTFLDSKKPCDDID